MSPLPTAPAGKRNVRPVTADEIAAAADPDALISLRVVRALTSLGASTIMRYVDAETFPAPHRVSRRIVRWRAGDVRAWLQARERRADPLTLPS